jgi:hypothetical protein
VSGSLRALTEEQIAEHTNFLVFAAGVELQRQIRLAQWRGDGNVGGLVNALHAQSRMCRELALALETAAESSLDPD